MAERIELGDRVKDRISGLKGIVTGVTYFLYGCTRMTLQPEEAKDGKPADGFWVDEPQLELVKKGIVRPTHPALQATPAEQPVPRRHGPRPDAKRAADCKR